MRNARSQSTRCCAGCWAPRYTYPVSHRTKVHRLLVGVQHTVSFGLLARHPTGRQVCCCSLMFLKSMRNFSMHHFKLDPCTHYTLPGLGFRTSVLTYACMSFMNVRAICVCACVAAGRVTAEVVRRHDAGSYVHVFSHIRCEELPLVVTQFPLLTTWTWLHGFLTSWTVCASQHPACPF